MIPKLDNRDREIIVDRMAKFDARKSPRVGDFVDFADGDTTRRIGAHWDDHVQLVPSGSFYLGQNGCSHSGTYFSGLYPKTELALTDQTRPGSIWIHHHGHREAHNGVDATAVFRVYTCQLPPPTE